MFEDRNVKIVDYTRLETVLSCVNYYNFKHVVTLQDTFNETTSSYTLNSNQLIDVYQANEDLGSIFMKVCRAWELKLKRAWAYGLGEFSPTAYADLNIYSIDTIFKQLPKTFDGPSASNVFQNWAPICRKDAVYWKDCLQQLIPVLAEKNGYIQKSFERYTKQGKLPPIWVIVDTLSMDKLGYWVSGLPQTDTSDEIPLRKVLREMGFDTNLRKIKTEQWLKVFKNYHDILTTLRNKIAHHEKIIGVDLRSSINIGKPRLDPINGWFLISLSNTSIQVSRLLLLMQVLTILNSEYSNMRFKQDLIAWLNTYKHLLPKTSATVNKAVVVWEDAYHKFFLGDALQNWEEDGGK